MVLHTYD